jgi:hypothetical protein
MTVVVAFASMRETLQSEDGVEPQFLSKKRREFDWEIPAPNNPTEDPLRGFNLKVTKRTNADSTQ